MNKEKRDKYFLPFLCKKKEVELSQRIVLIFAAKANLLSHPLHYKHLHSEYQILQKIPRKPLEKKTREPKSTNSHWKSAASSSSFLREFPPQIMNIDQYSSQNAQLKRKIKKLKSCTSLSFEELSKGLSFQLFKSKQIFKMLLIFSQ